MIQINPLKSYIDGGVRAALTTPPSASLVFDLPGKAIWVKGVKLKGTDHTYIFNHDNYITLTNTPDKNNPESEDIKIGVNITTLKNAIDTTYSGGTLALLQEGLNTEERTWQAKILHNYINDVLPVTKNLKINGTNYAIYTTENSLPQFFVPVSLGTTGQILACTSSGLSWIDQIQNTDYRVSQSSTTSNSDYRIILKQGANNNPETDFVRFSEYLTFNPYTKTLKINNIKVVTATDIYTGSTAGLVPVATSAQQNYYLRGDGAWVNIATEMAAANTWRPIKVENTDALGSSTDTGTLSFIAGTGIALSWDATNKRIIITNSSPDVNHNTDETVRQVPKTDNVNRPLMMINGSTSAGEQINTSMFSTGIYANASTKMITANGFIKAGSSDDYVLLGGGNHKALSDFSMSHTHPYLPLAGGTMIGTIKFNGNTSLPQKTLQYVCGIDAFANGGEMGWMGGPEFVTQYAPTKTGIGASGTWNINISGNAATANTSTEATYLTASSISDNNSGLPAVGDRMQLFRTSAASNGAVGGDGHILGFTWAITGGYGAQIYIDTDPTYNISIRQRNSMGNWIAWKRIPMGDGTGASGTWGIDINGNAATATNTNMIDGQHLMTQVSDWNADSLSIFKSSENSTSNAPTTDYTYGVTLRFHRDISTYYTNLVTSLYYDRLFFRRKTESGYQTWRELIHSGNIGSQSVNYANSAGSADTANSAIVWKRTWERSHDCLVDIPSSETRIYMADGNTANKPCSGAGFIIGHSWDWGYGGAMIYQDFDGNDGGRLYTNSRQCDGAWQGWNKIAFVKEIPTVTNYYWANIKVSASSSTSTSPTFESLWINNSHFFKQSGTTFTCQGGTTFTLPSSSLNTNTALLWTTASDGARDTGIFYNSSDFAFIANSNDHGAVFAVYDTDVTQDFEAGAREISVPGNGGALWARGGFSKNGSSDSYVLLGGGGHKAISDFSMSHSHPYLPLSGGTMTGDAPITFQRNRRAINFSNNDSLKSVVQFMTSGNEALVFANQYNATSYMFFTGLDLPDNNSDWYNLGTPDVQIKQKCLYVNQLLGNGVVPSYNLYVNGTAYVETSLNLSSLKLSYGNTALDINTPYGHAYVGPMNESYCHIYTDIDGGFYFNKDNLYANGNRILTASNYSLYALPLSGGTMTGQINWTPKNLSAGDYSQGLLRFDRGYQDYSDSRRYFPWMGGSDYVSGYGYGNTISIGAYHSGTDNCGLYIGMSWDGNNSSVYMTFSRFGDITASNFYSSSDIRLKNNINNISKSIRSFNWKESGQKSYGLIAQEIENEYPELVSSNDNGYKSINYTSALCMLVAKLENGVDELKEKVKQLEDKLRKYENTL